MMDSDDTQGYTQEAVDALLVRLQSLRVEVVQARTALTPLETNLQLAYNEYQDRIRSIRREISRLQLEIDRLLLRMKRDRRLSAEDGPDEGGEDVTGGDGDEGDGDNATWEPSESLDAIAKDELIEHAYRVLDPMVDSADGELIGQLQGMVSDPVIRLGDVLEKLEWGVIWEARARQEMVADQYRRLSKWEQALANQLTVLKKGEERLKRDRRYGLWQQRRKGPQAWRRFLEQAAGQYEQERQRLEGQLQELREEWERM